jgi:acetyltransferase
MRQLTREQYESLVNPRSVAVVGVSERTGAQAYNLVENLDEAGCAARVYPVNTRAREIVGRKAYRSLADIPHPIDLAVVSTPREAVPEVARQCVGKGVRAMVVITQGFGDADAEGRRLQTEIDAILAGSGTRLVGPNTIGVANLLDRFHTSFQRFDLDAQPTAWVTQSGAFILGAAEFSGGLGIGIDVGNAADVGFAEVLPWLARDPRIEVINLHMEGVGDGPAFLAQAAEAARAKPVIAFKTGRSGAGARAAVSHSGSLAGDDRAFGAALRKAGVLRADTLEELADLNRGLLTWRSMRGPRVAVVTISGGTGIAAVDALAAQGLEIAPLADATKAGLQSLFPAWFAVDNPVDFWPAAMRGGYRETCVAVLDLLLADPNVDAVLFVIAAYRATGLEVIGPVLEAVAARAAAQPATPVAFWIFGANQDAAIAAVERAGPVAGFTSPERAARALAAVRRRAACLPAAAADVDPIEGIDVDRARRVIAAAAAAGVGVLGAGTLELLDAYGIPTAPARRAQSVDAAQAAAQALGYPVALKIASPDLAHKSDSGGVRLDLADAAALRAAWEEMAQTVRARAPGARIDGADVQRFHAGGTELIVGARRDPVFGPVVVFGLGGIHTEILGDVAVRLAPLGAREAREMLDELRAARILDGLRGAPALDRDAIVRCIVRVGRLMHDLPEIAELDINPLAAWPHGVRALDARAVLGPRV